ncbi:hypothetical protein [[Eubacterium] hominis]|uniref:hypothetical protein n=1 Tax=[Eubacterium] hominis TaxID=2764325 RepID=UPI003A4D3408
MKNKKTSNISKASILFYVMAVLFLFAALFFAYLTYQSIAEYKQSAEPSLSEVFSVYISNCGSYIAYSFILYGIGVILNKFSVMTNTIADCMVEAVEDHEEEEDSLDEFLNDLSQNKANHDIDAKEANDTTN